MTNRLLSGPRPQTRPESTPSQSPRWLGNFFPRGYNEVVDMSALGHKPTYAVQNVMSALPLEADTLPLEADICIAQAHVCYGPIADIGSLSGQD